MLHNYQKTPLEQWIEEIYLRIGITSPVLLNIHELGDQLKIWYYFLNMGSQAIDREGKYSICIDKRLSPVEQWEDFLHELCHVLRHSGDQTNMPKELSVWQEQDASTFQLYAAIPFFMIKDMDLPRDQNELIEYLSFNFGVTRNLACCRLEQIQRRIFQGVIDEKSKQFILSANRKYSPANWSNATRAIMDQLYKQKTSK